MFSGILRSGTADRFEHRNPSGVDVTAGCDPHATLYHRTEIGDGAFIGSNSTLVAPVTVEIDSYVGAGSVITDRVPEGTLALGRARQVIKEGWKRKKKI